MNPAVRLVVVVCAWCEPQGRHHGAARRIGERTWYDVPHSFVTALNRQGHVSHGICGACRASVRADYRLTRER